MSFSSPTTSKPWRAKWRADSEPIRPPDPVTIATGDAMRRLRRLESRAHGVLVRTDPLEDVGEDLACGAARAPVGQLEQAAAVGDVERDVAGALLGQAADLDAVAGDLGAQVGRLAQRERDLAAAACVGDHARPLVRGRELRDDELDDVVDVDEVAHLFAAAAEAEVRQRLTEV